MIAPLLFCSIYDRPRVAGARELVASLLAHAPGAEIVLLYAGQDAPMPIDGCETLALDALGEDAWTLAATTAHEQRDGVLLGPLLRVLLARGAPVVFLGETMRALGALDPVTGALADADVVLVALADERLPDDGLRPPASVIDAAGVVNRRVLAVRPGAAADALLRAWPRHSEPELPTVPPELAPGAVQRHLDRFAAAAGSRVLGAHGLVAGYWNLPLYTTVANGDGVVVNGEPLALIDLLGLDPADAQDPWPHSDRLRLSTQPELAKVLARLSQPLRAAASKTQAFPDFVLDAEGRPMDAMHRALLREALAGGAVTKSLWTGRGAAEWEGFLSAPAEHGAGAGLTRYHETIWRTRGDLAEAFGVDLDGPAGELYRGWLAEHGTSELQLQPRDVPSVETAPEHPPLPWGTNVAGFFGSELGLGEAARLLIAGLDAAKVPALPVQGSYVPPTRQAAEFSFTTPDQAPYPINIVCLNGDVLPEFGRDARRSFFEQRHTIAMWWWEVVGAFPASWKPAFALVDEIWVATDHVYEAIAPSSPVPVHKVRMPVAVPRIRPYDRAELGMPSDGFVFLYCFDYHSTAARKNPIGAVEAFRRAFGEGSGAKLVLKCINGERMLQQHERTLMAIGGHPDITVIDRFVSADEKNAMVANCDCYLSLHRSEGFGLTPAEAMALGKPVVATAYGGVLEFMSEETAFLVRHSPIEVGPGASPYPPDGVWADPDLDHAAELMRHVVADADDAARRGAAAARHIRAYHSPEVAGALMRARLETAYDELSAAAGPHAPRVPQVGGVTARPLAPVGGRASALKRPLRRAVERALEPFADRQRAIDRALGADVAALRDALEAETTRRDEAGERALRAERAQTLAALRRVHAQLDDHERWLHAATRAHEHHIAEHRALPWAATAWERFEDPVAGTVEGYRAAPGTPSPAAYREFEDRFRGSRERVLELQRPYLELLAGRAPVLDLGCGRGELLQLLRDAGVPARGVDADAQMAAVAARLGLDVGVGDALEALAEAGDASLGAITAMQVVEHLAPEVLRELLAQSRRALRDGGRLIVETVNPHALQAMKVFWLDPTHHHPLFADTVLALCRSAGFASAFVVYPGGSDDLDADRHGVTAYAVVADVL